MVSKARLQTKYCLCRCIPGEDLNKAFKALQDILALANDPCVMEKMVAAGTAIAHQVIIVSMTAFDVAMINAERCL